ncbi:hypothetical protein CR513_20035, partial [Mucuna pruriens]
MLTPKTEKEVRGFLGWLNYIARLISQLMHDETSKKEHAIYYLSKKFMDYEMRYSSLERTCCALAWAT